jgi:hypothetical protein
MAWDKGFDFRGTSGYVTDPANCTYVLGEAYPTTRNSVTFGWEGTTASVADRDAGISAKLAGINFANPAKDFRVDLPAAGPYLVSLAVGDQASGSNAVVTTIIKDTATTLMTLTGQTVTAEFYDATGALLTTAAWPAGNVAVEKTFATTLCRMSMSIPSGFWRVAHLFLSQVAVVASASATPTDITTATRKKYMTFQKNNPSKTTDVNLATGDTNKADVIAVKSANHQLWIQKIVYNPITVAAQAVTFQDDAGTPVKIGTIPASQSTPLTLDFGPKGVALTAGKNLDISNTAGPAAQIHIEAYEKIVSGTISTATSAAGQ